MELTPELDAQLQEMARRIGPGGYTKLMMDGLGMVKIALDAREEGKRLLLIDDRDNSEQEIAL
jgi:hypothetical protein